MVAMVMVIMDMLVEAVMGAIQRNPFYLQIYGLPTEDKNDILHSVYYVFLF